MISLWFYNVILTIYYFFYEKKAEQRAVLIYAHCPAFRPTV